MKLSIIMDRYESPFAGTESQVLKLVEGLLARHWDIRFAVFRGTDYTRSGEFPVPVEDLQVNSLSSPVSWLRVYRYARKLRADGFTVVHVFFNDASVICPPMMRAAGLKTLISRRDMGFWYSDLYLRILSLTGRCVNGVVCNSQAVAEVTNRLESVPTDKLHVIYNGYPDQPVSVNKEIDDSPDDSTVVIGIVANLRPIKRIEDLIEAVGLVHKEGHQVELRIVGGGDPEPYLHQINQLGLESKVHLLGSQPNPEEHIQGFDIAVLCSETEGFSNAIIEYMRCGKPVICTQTGGNPEIIEEGVNGFLVPVGDTDALARRLIELIMDPDKRRAMGAASVAQLTTRYSLDTMLSQHIALYREIEPGMAQA